MSFKLISANTKPAIHNLFLLFFIPLFFLGGAEVASGATLGFAGTYNGIPFGWGNSYVYYQNCKGPNYNYGNVDWWWHQEYPVVVREIGPGLGVISGNGNCMEYAYWGCPSGSTYLESACMPASMTP